jgi:4-hydroxythreonine-4-phosphate dehydrogenase
MSIDASRSDVRVRRIAVSLGDPRGIGPEVAAKALRHPELQRMANFLLVGPPRLTTELSDLGETLSVSGWEPRDGAATAGRVAGEAVAAAVDLAVRGEVDAVVTAPIDKAAFRAGGWEYPGHTEMLQSLSAAPDVAMMMVAESTRMGGALRVLLATTHLALRDVPTALSVELIVSQTTLAHDALRAWWGIDEPRLAICGVNPHASDGGLFGDEEERIIAPALALLRDRGVRAVGAVPADTVFARALSGEWDAVVAPYHDVGMAAFKTVAFGRGVNVTLGLPFPRTSPDHGTALDIAGTDRADPASMIEAVRLAIRLAERFDRTAGVD